MTNQGREKILAMAISKAGKAPTLEIEGNYSFCRRGKRISRAP